MSKEDPRQPRGENAEAMARAIAQRRARAEPKLPAVPNEDLDLVDWYNPPTLAEEEEAQRATHGPATRRGGRRGVPATWPRPAAGPMDLPPRSSTCLCMSAAGG